MTITDTSEKIKITENLKKLIVLRLETMPSNWHLSIGGFGDLSRDELIDSVEKENELGKKIIQIQLRYLRAMKDISNG
jgi:hypothetical protein